MKLCSDLHYNLSMNFDFSYSFEKGKQWMRIPNIFNLSNEIVTRVRSSTKMKYLQHQREIECNTNDLIESDIIPSETRESTTIKKTVNIEVGDMDLETINFSTNGEDNKENGDSSGSSPIASSNKEQEVKEKFSEDDSNKFKIKNFELTKEFMKGRQCGRENTPIRGRERKERKKKLAKINVNLPKSGQMKKAWDDDSQLSPVGNSMDPVENFSNLKEIKRDRSKVQFKQFQKKVKVVRVQSSRRDSKSHKKNMTGRVRRTKKRAGRRNMPPLPFAKAKTAPEQKPPSVTGVNKECSVKINLIWRKFFLLQTFTKWKKTTIRSKKHHEESKDPGNQTQNWHRKMEPQFPSSPTLHPTSKHEISKSVLIGTEIQPIYSQNPDQSWPKDKKSKTKKHRRRMTKEAFQRYKEINFLLEKLSSQLESKENKK